MASQIEFYDNTSLLLKIMNICLIVNVLTWQ
jgi:hypothetical protein